MSNKWIGALMIVLGCSGFGFLIADSTIREEKHLRELHEAVSFMLSELQYRLTPLPELIARAAENTSGPLWQVFSALDRELVGQVAPNAEACMQSALAQTPAVPALTGDMLVQLGRSLGRFDLNGQVAELTFVKEACKENLSKLSQDRTQRLRSYRTLGICAGIALAILLI